MADVTPDMPSTSPAERGQLILVTALALAILFVSLALIVNTAIYTENLATRGSDVGGGTEAVRYHDSVQSGVGGLIELANENETLNGNNESLQTELRAGVATIDNRSGSQFALSNRAVEAELKTTNNGTRIAQTDADRNFTNVSDEPDWTVVEDVNNTRNLVINISNVQGDDFRLNLTNASSETWVLNVTDGGGGSTIGVTNGTGAEFTCSGDDMPLIDVTAGTVDGDRCDGLVLAEGIDTPYDISIENGSDIDGSYTMIVDNKSLAGAPEPHLVEGEETDTPFATHAIYSANVTVTYQTPRLFYNATVRVAPGEPDG